MRRVAVIPMLRDILRVMQRELTGLLLAGAMLSPIAAATLGWRVHTPFAMPLIMHETLLVAIALVAAVAAGFAVIVDERANVFYTERALVDGMTLLFALQLGVRLLRRRAVRRLGLHVAAPEPSRRWRRGAEWRRRFRARCLPATPGIRVSDALVAAVGWLLLTAWVLIALEHRHPAGPMLLAAGGIELLALLALVPDVLAGTGWLGPDPSLRRPDEPDHLALMQDDAHAHESGDSHFSRRHP